MTASQEESLGAAPIDLPVPPALLGAEEKAALRSQVRLWARRVLGESKYTRRAIETRMRKHANWLGVRLAAKGAVNFAPEDLLSFARALSVEIPEEIQGAAEKLFAGGRFRSSSPFAKLRPLDGSRLEKAGSAEGEIRLILEGASQGRHQGQRDLGWVYRRLGIGTGHAETLEEIGSSSGVTRERVRQVESKMMGLARVVAHNKPLPMLTAVHERVKECCGLPWDVVEMELKPLLCSVPLREAIRFFEELTEPEQRVGFDRASIYGLGNTLLVVAQSPSDTRFTTQVSIAARKLYSYAGAGLVHDVRSLVEGVMKQSVSMRDLVRALSGLPEIEWLDSDRRWFWFNSPDLSPLLRKTAGILVGAGVPVDMETLYSGLVREGRRDKYSSAAYEADPVPPWHVVLAILKRHPLFKRSAANSFTYIGPTEPLNEFEPSMQRILNYLDEVGGVATRAQLQAFVRREDLPISDYSLTYYFYSSGRIERIGQGAWAIRGRPISETRRREVLADSRQIERPEGPRWTAVVELTEASRRNRLVGFSASDMPLGVEGLYRMPDGHVAMVRQDQHGARMTRLGEHLKSLMQEPTIKALRFEFDSEAKTVSVHAG